jgi:hypothetical protein
VNSCFGIFFNSASPSSFQGLYTPSLGRRNFGGSSQIVLFKFPPTQGNEEFVQMIKNRVDLTNPPPRYEVLEANYEYSDHRGYPCVRYRSLYIDKEALTTSGAREPMKLQVVALYCRHPMQQEIVFFVAYSHRGAKTDPDLDNPAQKFIDGVQVPQQSNK